MPVVLKLFSTQTPKNIFEVTFGHFMCDKSVQFQSEEQKKKGPRPICESKYFKFYNFQELIT